jgi:hypothetical protein
MNQDLSTDENIEGADGADDLEKQFLRPGYVWHGLSLRPYGVVSDILSRQVLDRNDGPEFMLLGFVFIHVYDEEKLLDLCWDKRKYRKAVLEWAKSLGEITTDDYAEALKMFEEIRGFARKSSVEVVPDPSLPQKKTKATRQRASPV